MRKIIIATFATISFSTASAQDRLMMVDAGNLLDICTAAHPDFVGFCNGFVQAAHDFPATSSDVLTVCPPRGTTRTELVEVYVAQAQKLFADQPQFRNEPAILVTRTILARAFPC